MFCAAVTQFIDKLSLFTEQDISLFSKISGYGIGCIADGILGVYKLEIEFGKKKPVMWQKLRPHDRLKAAAIIDYTLKYYHKERQVVLS